MPIETGITNPKVKKLMERHLPDCGWGAKYADIPDMQKFWDEHEINGFLEDYLDALDDEDKIAWPQQLMRDLFGADDESTFRCNEFGPGCTYSGLKCGTYLSLYFATGHVI